jgi:hypothetical protein
MPNRMLQTPLAMVVSVSVPTVPLPSLGISGSNIGSAKLLRDLARTRGTDDFMGTLGRVSQAPFAQKSLAPTLTVESSETIRLSESDEFKIDADLSDLIGLMADSLRS